MIKNRKLCHLGIYTSNMNLTVMWYTNELGYKVIGNFTSEDGYNCVFIKNDSGITYELISPPEKTKIDINGKIDHIAYVSCNITEDYYYCSRRGFTFTTDGIQTLNNFWENGCSYFKVITPTREEIEFCQIL